MSLVHAIRALGRTASVAGLTLVLSACAVFAPPYDATLDQKTTAAYESAAKLAAEAEMGAYQDKATYPGKVETYAGIQAGLAVAALRAGSAPTSGQGAERARDLTVGLIKSCGARVSSLATLHKAQGIKADAGLTEPMMSSCDLAARAVRAMKN
ncbi:hypothetical protein [Caulobacter sp.]|uniref:hypothetical protein n=1 Tax=Caulobacter sp. TaxID=78 RepID=UPI003BB08451